MSRTLDRIKITFFRNESDCLHFQKLPLKENMRLIIYFIFVTLFIATTWIGSSEGCTSHMIEERIDGKLSQTTNESSGTLHTIAYKSRLTQKKIAQKNRCYFKHLWEKQDDPMTFFLNSHLGLLRSLRSHDDGC